MTADFMDDCAIVEPAPAAFALGGWGYSPFDVSSYVMTDSTPAWLGRARSQLEELGRLQPGWDSYGARPISAMARKATYELLQQLASPRTPQPALVPTSDGSIQIEWHTKGIDLEIRVLSTTRVSVYLEDAHGQAPGLDGELEYDFTSLGEAIRALSSR